MKIIIIISCICLFFFLFGVCIGFFLGRINPDEDTNDEIETIEPGKWIENHTTCSSCGWKMIDDVTGSVMMVGFKHCPECGTRMEE